MTDTNQIGWGSYMSYEGPLFYGVCPLVPSPNPSEEERVLSVITATEGGHFDAINMYDRMIVSVGLIQWGEAGQYSVSDMLGQVIKRDPMLLAPLTPALKQAGATFQTNAKGRYRFFRGGNEVDTVQEQQRLFLLNSDGTKGMWDNESKAYAKLWTACLANVFQQVGAQQAQLAFTVQRLSWFATADAKAALWAPDDPEGFPQGWVGALRAAFLSFAANLPAVAAQQLQTALGATKAERWSEEWCVAILKQLTFGPNITIYPGRYNSIRPVVERLFGVDMPDFAKDLQAWHSKNNIDLTTGPGIPPTFLTVKEIQAELVAEGYDLGPSGADGVMGQKTKNAIMTFQRLHGLAPDGQVGPRTRKALVAEWEKRGH